jgi:hypothetical protein
MPNLLVRKSIADCENDIEIVVVDDTFYPPFSFNLNCGQASPPLAIQFTPPSEGPHSAFFTVSHSAAGSPTQINLLGEGCIANAEIIVPPTAPIDFGKVQKGYRTVKIFKVTGSGEGQTRGQ